MCFCACVQRLCVCISSKHVCVYMCVCASSFCSCLLKHQLMEGRLADVTSFNVLWFLSFNSKLHGTLPETLESAVKTFCGSKQSGST